VNDASFLWGVIFAYILMRIAAGFHYYLVPALDKSKMQEIIKFIAEYKNILLDSKKPFPAINIVEVRGLEISDATWRINNGLVDFAVEGYFPQWTPPRIWMVEGCRQNILVHALVHYVQFEYEPDALDEKNKETEAWAITKKYLKHAYPLNYWVLTIPFGIYCWWTSTPY